MINKPRFVAIVVSAAPIASACADSPYQDAVLASSPSAYWRFEGQGPVVPNAIGGSVAGSASGNVEFGITSASETLGLCARFISGNVAIANNVQTRPSEQYSIEFWTKSEGNNTGFVVAMGRDVNVGSMKIVMRPSFPDCTLICAPNDYVYGYWNVPNGSSVSDWHHYAFTWSRAEGFARFYVDGQLASDEPFAQSFAAGTSTIFVGQHDYPGFPFYFRGLVDELAIYQRALTPDEVQDHYCAAGVSPINCCRTDINRDGIVNGSDISVLLGFWGPTGTAFPAADINQDGIVNGGDLAALLSTWGPCSP